MGGESGFGAFGGFTIVRLGGRRLLDDAVDVDRAAPDIQEEVDGMDEASTPPPPPTHPTPNLQFFWSLGSQGLKVGHIAPTPQQSPRRAQKTVKPKSRSPVCQALGC